MDHSSGGERALANRRWKECHLDTYLRTGGAEGHLIDMRPSGGYRFTPTLLLRVLGRRTGQPRINPLIYGRVRGEVVVVASKGGAACHPAWFLNLTHSREAAYQIATQAFRCTWRAPSSTERAKLWEFMVAGYPPYETYQAMTSREIPLVILAPAEPIAVFREESIAIEARS